MDVKLSGTLARVGGALLALTACYGPLAVEAAVADDSSTMEFVTATDAASDLAPAAEPAEPSDLVIHIADDAAPAAVVDNRPAFAAHGDLTVVANSAPRTRVTAVPSTAVIVDSDVTPAAHTGGGLSWSSVLGSGPRRPSAASGIQSSQRGQVAQPMRQPSERYSASGPVAPPYVGAQAFDAPLAYDTDADNSFGASAAVNARRETPAAAPVRTARAVASTPAAVTRLKSPADHAKELLVSAYQLSLTAQNEAEYSQIIQWCASASRGKLDADSAQFGANLSAWALNRRGQCRADAGELDHALADFRAALEFTPDSYRALHNRAVTYAQTGQFAEAFDDLCRVVQLKPDFAKAYSNRATLYVQAGDFDHALADYQSALAADPKLLPALVGRGRLCHMQGKRDEALASLNAAIAIEPNDADIICSRADLLADLGRYEDALGDYAHAIDLNPKFEHAYRNGAWLLATCPNGEIRDVEGALAGAQAALDCGYGERHAALDTMAAALANAGKFQEAVGTLQQAIEIAPEETRAIYEARLHLYEAGEPFRTHPVGEEAAAAQSASQAAATEPSMDEDTAVYIEE